MGRVLNPAMKKKKKIWIYINILLLQETAILFCVWKPLDSLEGYYYGRIPGPLQFYFLIFNQLKPH